MTPQKRKADAASPAESSDESPYKRAKSEGFADTVTTQNEISEPSSKNLDGSLTQSTPIAKSLNQSQATRGTKNEAASPINLPHTWHQASAADKMLVDMKENTKTAWRRIERHWEQSTGETPTKGMLRDRYQHLVRIKAESKDTDAETAVVNVGEGSSEPPDNTTIPSGLRVKSTSPVVGGPPDKSSRSVIEHRATADKTLENAHTAPVGEVELEQDLPQSWEHANAGDQLIVRMKASRKAWTKIEEAWQRLTGEQPREGALRDRYARIKNLVICPTDNGANKHVYLLNNSTLDEVSHQANPRRAKSMPKTPRVRKPEAEPSEEPLDESSHKSAQESSHVSLKHSANITRKETRGATEEHAKASALDGSAGHIAKQTRYTTAESSEGKAAGSSDETDEISKASPAVTKSTERPRVKSVIAATSGGQDKTEAADEMLVQMRESGSTWAEISKAWAARTGIAYVSETLRQRYARIKKGSAPKLPSMTLGAQKRKAKDGSPDEGSKKSSRKSSKPTFETPHVIEIPTKRNMDRGKRKTSVKYTDSTTDEDELLTAPVEPAVKVPAPTRRGGGRAMKVDRSDPEWLVTNEKSPLANEDLHAEFSNPKTYEFFTKSDWEDLRDTLPPNVPVNPDGYSIPMTFFKYDPDFRRGIREFQEDLGSGRLDPKWQAEAAKAMEERARGTFDAYKEDQFEAFWGQKQKLNHDALAGESTKIKLELLIQNEIFKVGDYFSYSRVFGRGKSGVLMEKDCEIVRLDDKELTFAIPPGQRKFSRHMFEPKISGDTKAEAKAEMAGGDEEPLSNMSGKPEPVQLTADIETNGAEVSEASGSTDGALSSEAIPANGTQSGGNKPEDAETAINGEKEDENPAKTRDVESAKVKANIKSPENESHESVALKEEMPNEMSAHTNGGQSSTPNLQQGDEDILHSISNLTQLEHKIVDIDGRFNSKDISIQNTWKNFRGIRNNQDLGSLFEMREDFYVYKHPRIVKEPKRRR